MIPFLPPLPPPCEAVLYLWHHSSPFTEWGPISLQRQESFPGLSRPGVKMESYPTQLGGNCVAGRGSLLGSIMSVATSPLLAPALVKLGVLMFDLRAVF